MSEYPWAGWSTTSATTTAASASTSFAPLVISTSGTSTWTGSIVPVVTPGIQVTASGGHVPSYAPPRDEGPLEWLDRRINEVTDLVPLAA